MARLEKRKSPEAREYSIFTKWFFAGAVLSETKVVLHVGTLSVMGCPLFDNLR
ncbi:hypothetical protein [Dyella acidisoli]|uniref:hypothetical protein n=1 Tax=Dyella acidisoli TaxID=1867834 RepID=UPI0024E0A557|nr:hypothetical protein [Dyella acidisoli]